MILETRVNDSAKETKDKAIKLYDSLNNSYLLISEMQLFLILGSKDVFNGIILYRRKLSCGAKGGAMHFF